MQFDRLVRCPHLGIQRQRRRRRDIGVEETLPEEETKIPPGWTVAYVREFKTQTVETYFVYLCPKHTLTTSAKQASLFAEA